MIDAAVDDRAIADIIQPPTHQPPAGGSRFSVLGSWFLSPCPASWAYTWARLVGLLLLGYAVWLPVSARLWHYNRLGLLLGVLIVLALNVVVLDLDRARGRAPDR